MGNIIKHAFGKIRAHWIRYTLTVLWTFALLALAACGLTSSVVLAPSAAPVTPAPSPTATIGTATPTPSIQPVSTPDISPISTVSEPHIGPDLLTDLNQQYKEYGTFTIEGMSAEDYDAAMSLQWTKVETTGEPIPYDIDLTVRLDVDTLEQYILNLGRYDGVDITVIGHSELGRNIYMVTMNLGGGTDKPLIMLSGGVHAREFAGPDYLIKCLNDTLKKAQTDTYTKLLLSRVTIVAVPLVNPDGRELIMDGGDPKRKSNANGVDLNRAMPSVNAGQLIAGVKLTDDFADESGTAFFAGERLGTESETQAMMKWIDTYVPIATAYIDMHQQGGVSFYNKPFATSESDAACLQFARSMNALLGGGYTPWREHKNYAMNGAGGTLTDYARSVSEGFMYSYQLGRMALSMDGTETPLICFGDIDNCMEYYKPVNANFLCMTFEIGRKPSYLGPSDSACRKRAAEYEKYGWDDFIIGMIDVLLNDELLTLSIK